jgi:hypothetical protein
MIARLKASAYRLAFEGSTRATPLVTLIMSPPVTMGDTGVAGLDSAMDLKQNGMLILG